ncbi:hypothetical protein E2C01_089305 [Portunus trituberculatus]|uniref:Endonuclease/exonuclease/phosphatase domain-containing protein n=1 Tax=Portunus trituberculatus TaxID=210409 RepID=A0A5B7J8G2_PORTR|nr:hypothetical protein [Portunus trituberculatus]
MESVCEEGSWEAKVFNQMTENALYQHIREPMRVRGEDNPSRLDLVFTRKEEEIDNITMESPLGKGDHVVIACDVWLKYRRESGSQSATIIRYNFKRADVENMRKLFGEWKWFENVSRANSEEMLEEILRIYEEVVKKRYQ